MYKKFWGSHKLPQAHEKENEANKEEKRNDVCKNVIYERKPFIRPIQKTGENDLHKLRVNDYGYN